MTKRIFIIHGWGGSPNEIMLRLLKEKISNKGLEVISPQMPNTNEPKIEEWVQYLEKIVEKPDEETYFIGHSVGCQAIMRYIETLPEKIQVRKLIFIAGWFNLVNLEDEEEERIAEPWIKRPINFDRIKKISKEILVYISSNEYYGCIEENTKTFKEKLGAKVLFEENMGHFTDDEGKEKLSNFVDKLVRNID